MTPIRWSQLALAVLGASALGACWQALPSAGGGQGVAFVPPRRANPADVAVPAGYRVEVVAEGLTFPSGVCCDADGRVHVLEAGYSYGEAWAPPRLLRLAPGGGKEVVATLEHPPLTGLDFADGQFYVGEGGAEGGGRILRVAPDGQATPLIANIPSMGDHHTNRPVVGPDGWVYFGVGTATNAGVVGRDNHAFGWLTRHRNFHDVPGKDIVLAGADYLSDDPFNLGGAPVSTGAFVPFGTATRAGQVVPGQLPCNGAIMRIAKAGGPPELVAWGLRNPFGLAFAPDGKLFTTENGPDERGSRPVFGAPDCLWEVKPGTWFGWPDFVAGVAVTDPAYNQNPANPPLRFLLAEHPQAPPKPAARLAVHSSSNGFDFSRAAAFGHVGQAFVAQFGDQAPVVGKTLAPVGFKVVRVDVATGEVAEFAANAGPANGPASRIGGHGLERPVDCRFDPTGTSLYVVDFGILAMDPQPRPVPGTGVVWRIVKGS